jgi:hypothetical protein
VDLYFRSYPLASNYQRPVTPPIPFSAREPAGPIKFSFLGRMRYNLSSAAMAELADAPASGAGAFTGVVVRIHLAAPINQAAFRFPIL